MQQLEMDFETGVWKELTPEVVLHKSRMYVLRRPSGNGYAYAIFDYERLVVPLRNNYNQYLELPA